MGLFLFDNAPSHQKWADNALSARKMLKNPMPNWVHQKGGRSYAQCNFTKWAAPEPLLWWWSPHHSRLVQGDGNYHLRMQFMARKCLLVQCESFWCKNGLTNCCCWHLLFCQPDFETQKSCLEKFITFHWHICDFYPKYHCELNFIEQYWGAAKFCYCNTTWTTNIIEMEENMIAWDNVPLLQIIWYDI